MTFRYFYDDAGQLFRVLDSTGTLLEYAYDASGNIINVGRSTVAPSSVAIFNIVPLITGPGQTITILGQNFSAVAVNDIVTVNGIPATVLAASGTSLTVRLGGATSSGPILVTVGGVTASSGALQISASLPLISAVVPDGGSTGKQIAVTVQGANLNGATFDLQGGGVVNSVTSSTATQAVINLTPGANPGEYAMVATNSAGLSASTLTPSNRFTVLYGPNEADSPVITVLNTSFPPGSVPSGGAFNEADSPLVMVLNTAYDPASVPTAGAFNEADSPLVMVLNTAYDPASVPTAGAFNEADSPLVMVLNTAYNPASEPSGGAFNEADSLLVSLTNGAIVKATVQQPPALISTSGRLLLDSGSDGSVRPMRIEPGATVRELLPGETIRLLSPTFPDAMTYIFEVNGVPVGSSQTGQSLFTVPDSLREMTFSVTAMDAAGEAVATSRMPVQIAPRTRRTVSGKVVDASGRPIQKARVRIIPAGLVAELFHFDYALTGIPDLLAMTPRKTSFLTSVNLLNPQGIFGRDPYASGLTPDSVLRVTGRLWAPDAGEYGFRLRTHMGARLSIDEGRVIDVLAPQGNPVTKATSIHLEAGWHAIELTHFEAVGFPELQLQWTRPGLAEEVIAPEFLDAVQHAASEFTREDGSFEVGIGAELKRFRIEIVEGSRVTHPLVLRESVDQLRLVVNPPSEREN